LWESIVSFLRSVQLHFASLAGVLSGIVSQGAPLASFLIKFHVPKLITKLDPQERNLDHSLSLSPHSRHDRGTGDLVDGGFLNTYNDEDDVVDAAHTSMYTHQGRNAHLGAEFFARVTYRVIHQSLTPREAIDKVAAESDPWIQKKVKQALTKAQEAMDPEQALSTEEFVDDLALTSKLNY
jgi:hypothetical protein